MDKDVSETAGHPRVGLVGATLLVVGGMIGSGVFLLPATMGAMGSISLLGWIAATIGALAVGGMYAAIARAAPEARGLAQYVEVGLGRGAAVQTGFLYWVSCWVGTAAVAVAVAGYIAFLVPALASTGGRMATIVAVTWLGVLIGWVGPRAVARAEGLTLALGLAPVLGVAIFGWFWFDPELFARSWNPQQLGLGPAIAGSALAATWAFTGLESAAASAAVVRDPERNVPGATLFGIAVTAVLYIAASAAIMGLLPPDRLAASTAPFADAAGVMLGAGLASAVAVCAAVRAWGCFTTYTLNGPETSRAAADAGAFPAVFRTRPGERVSPVNLAIFGLLMTIVGVATVTPSLAHQFTTLANVSVLLGLYTNVLCAGSLVRLSSAFTSRGRVLAIATAALVTVGCVALTFVARPMEILWSAAAVGLGVLLHLYVRRQERPAYE